MSDKVEFPKGACHGHPEPSVHCFHSVYVPSPHQAGQYDAREMRCCWCGDQRPLTIFYSPPPKHGPHAPNNPTGQPPLWR